MKGDMMEKTPNTDPELIAQYDKVYKSGQENFFTFPSTEERMAILSKVNFQGKRVLEIGCGTGYMAGAMIESGAAMVDAYDLSEEAIKKAVSAFGCENLNFYHGDPCDMPAKDTPKKTYDIVVMIGVLEHVDDPAQYLDTMFHLFMGTESILACSCPLFLNPRGYIWVALKYLFDAPMSLTDRHEIGPAWFVEYAKDRKNVLMVDVKTVDDDWGRGDRMLKDLIVRLPKVFPDMDISKITKLVSWLKFEKDNHLGHGANAVYFLKKI